MLPTESIARTAALRDFSLVYVACGSMLLKKSSMISPSPHRRNEVPSGALAALGGGEGNKVFCSTYTGVANRLGGGVLFFCPLPGARFAHLNVYQPTLIAGPNRRFGVPIAELMKRSTRARRS